MPLRFAALRIASQRFASLRIGINAPEGSPDVKCRLFRFQKLNNFVEYSVGALNSIQLAYYYNSTTHN